MWIIDGITEKPMFLPDRKDSEGYLVVAGKKVTADDVYDLKKKLFAATNHAYNLSGEKFKKKVREEAGNDSLLKFCDKTVDVIEGLSDNGLPLKNEFLEKQKDKERIVLQDYKEKSYTSFVKDLLQFSDDIFDSKGNNISDKEFLKNEMSID